MQRKSRILGSGTRRTLGNVRSVPPSPGAVGAGACRTRQAELAEASVLAEREARMFAGQRGACRTNSARALCT